MDKLIPYLMNQYVWDNPSEWKGLRIQRVDEKQCKSWWADLNWHISQKRVFNLKMLCEQYTFKYSKTCVKRPLLKRLKIGLQDLLSINAGQKYGKMLQGEHSAILWTFIKLPFVFKIFFCVFLSERFRQVLLYDRHYGSQESYFWSSGKYSSSSSDGWKKAVSERIKILYLL